MFQRYLQFTDTTNPIGCDRVVNLTVATGKISYSLLTLLTNPGNIIESSDKSL